MENHPEFSLSQFMTIFVNIPLGQMVFFALFAGTWLIGGNIIVARHYKRLGKSPWFGFKPFAYPFTNFNAKEWLALAVLAVMSLTFGAIALSLNGK
jgi:hypothetical protein